MDIVHGPRAGAFAPDATITCDFNEKDFGGDDPKFACAIDAPAGQGSSSGDIVKVRYGRDNGEVYAGVAATRLLWALGFGADVLYPVRVVCRGCPAQMQPEGMATERAITFDVAAVERKFPGREIDSFPDEGWSWPELDSVSAKDGGASRAQRDGLKLLLAVLQHTDSKAAQQRLVCADERVPASSLAACAHPFMLVHDVGHTFAHARVLTGLAARSALRDWTATPVWKDASRCVATVTPNAEGTLRDPVISEEGREFLAGLLDQLSESQMRDLFTVARFDRAAHAGDSVDAWVSAFRRKRDEIDSARCGSSSAP